MMSNASAKQPTTNQQSNCLGVILAGGQSSRMGQDKALLRRNQESMHSFCQQLLNRAGISDIVTSANEQQNPALFSASAPHDTVTDRIKNAGPLGGIFSVIEQYRPKALLILPVDLPLINSDVIQQLKTAGQLSQKACYYQDNYLPLYLPVNGYLELFMQQAFSNFSGKGPSMKGLLKAMPSQCLPLTNSQALFNSNTPEQWAHAQQQFSSLTSTSTAPFKE